MSRSGGPPRLQEAPHDHRRPGSTPSIVALVHRDLGAAVRDAAAHTLSPYVAAARLEHNLEPLRQRIDLAGRQRPGLLRQLADHYRTPPETAAVDAAVTRHAHLLLVRRHAHAAGTLDELPPLTRPGDDAAARLRAATEHQQSLPAPRAAAMRADPPPR